MKADKTTIANLQTTCSLLSSLKEQYRVDVYQLKGMDLDWLACRVKKWYHRAEHHLGLFIKRLIYLEQDPVYDTDTVKGISGVDAMLSDREDTLYGILDQLVAFRAAAWDSRADSIPDLYEHAIQDLENDVWKIERERKLIATLTEPGYIGSRLSDG